MTPREEAKFIIEREFEKTIRSLRQQNLEINDKNLLNEFVIQIETMLAEHFQTLRGILTEVEFREATALELLKKAEEMMKHVAEYKNQLDKAAAESFEAYLKMVNAEFIEKYKNLFKPNYN